MGIVRLVRHKITSARERDHFIDEPVLDISSRRQGAVKVHRPDLGTRVRVKDGPIVRHLAAGATQLSDGIHAELRRFPEDEAG